MHMAAAGKVKKKYNHHLLLDVNQPRSSGYSMVKRDDDSHSSRLIVWSTVPRLLPGYMQSALSECDRVYEVCYG